MNRRTAALALVALGLGAHLLWGAIRRGWSQMGTDFPNYYTAAVLTRHGAPLRLFYDWTWFQRQIHYTGIEHQLGGYTPFTPATMLPFLPLTFLDPQTAKRVWIVLELLFLAASIVLLAQWSRMRVLEVLVVTLAAHAALETNFLLAQFYIAVLLLLTCSIGCLLRGREVLGGVLMGAIFAMKLYTAPFLLFFAVRRQWRAFWGFVGAVACFGVVAVALFGFHAVWFFATTVMTRGLDGLVIDPYNQHWSSMTALLRRSLVAEAELNPQPLANAPAAFFFLRDLYTLGALAIALVAVSARSVKLAHALAWFTIVLFVLSPNMASYHYIVLAAPIVLLLQGASLRWGAGLILLYVAVELPLYPWDVRFYPKAWLLLALAVYAASRCRPGVRPRVLYAAVAVVAVLSAGDTMYRMRALRKEPPQRDHRAVVHAGSLLESSSAVTARGLVYEAMGRESYVIRTDRGDEYSFDGDAFHPSATADGESIYFELASNGHSQVARLRLPSRKVEVAIGPDWNPTEPAVSPDGTQLVFVSGGWLYAWEGGQHLRLAGPEVSAPSFFPDGRRIAFAQGPPGRRRIVSVSISGEEVTTLASLGDCTEPAVSLDGRKIAFGCEETGAQQIWIQDLSSGQARRVTDGGCTNRAPAWTLDSRFVIFASDCSRGLGLTTLFRTAAE
jgi:hypothetical protein